MASAAALSLVGETLVGAAGTPLNPGDILVSDLEAAEGLGALIRVDPVTGAQTTIFAGSPLFAPRHVAVTPDGMVLLADPFAGADIVAIDASMGTATIFATGGFLAEPHGVVVAANGDVFVADPGASAIIRLAAGTGAQSIVAAGGNLDSPIGIAIETTGHLVVTDSANYTGVGVSKIIRVDPETGVQTILSSAGVLFNPTGIAVAGDGGLMVIDSPAGVIRIDPDTGAQTVVSTGGGFFVSPSGIAIDSNGDLLIADFNAVDGNGAVIRVNPVTGDAAVVSSDGGFKSPYGITIYRPAVTVSIDIKPGSSTNSINLGAAGTVPVAILSSPTFDAALVDPDTITLAGARIQLVGRGNRSLCALEDVNGDGLLDLVCHVETAQFLLEPGDSTAVLEASTYAGLAVRGEDSIRIVPD